MDYSNGEFSKLGVNLSLGGKILTKFYKPSSAKLQCRTMLAGIAWIDKSTQTSLSIYETPAPRCLVKLTLPDLVYVIVIADIGGGEK